MSRLSWVGGVSLTIAVSMYFLKRWHRIDLTADGFWDALASVSCLYHVACGEFHKWNGAAAA